MATKKWFVLVGAEEMGPLGPRGLRQMVRKGEIGPDTLLRREDHACAVAAAQVRGLLATAALEPHRSVHGHARAKIHGPFTELRVMGRSLAAVLALFAALGLLGVYFGVAQWRHAETVLAGAPMQVESADPGLFGIGVFAVLSLVLAGGLFIWWLWTASVNLPHLIAAHVHYAPSWAIAGWFMPFLNLIRPLAVVTEIDQLSAEAEADGDASVRANRPLLLSWWTAAVFGTVLALVYLLLGKTTPEGLRIAALAHFAAGLFTMIAGALAAWLVLRITDNQERAHARHPDPVPLHRDLGARRGRAAQTA
ncbi:MAG: DUF4328 domain-containing protein [Planctomycetes bacterium]|nr:DUF4328 domain-containing protein [Planctomycetota bacterium]MCB9886824.1 DUF4328 domain-containing protein [Planctomycetota bacterium]